MERLATRPPRMVVVVTSRLALALRICDPFKVEHYTIPIFLIPRSDPAHHAVRTRQQPVGRVRVGAQPDPHHLACMAGRVSDLGFDTSHPKHPALCAMPYGLQHLLPGFSAGDQYLSVHYFIYRFLVRPHF